MGSGVSKPSARHSDSRVDEVRSELVKEAHAHVHGSSTLTLTLSLQEYANSLRSSAESSKSKSKKRAHSLPTANNTGPRSGGVWGKLGGHAASSVVQTTGSSEEMQEEVDVHDSVAPVQRTASATATTEEGEEEDEEYYEDDFEDEIVDWKKGDSIGSGSYGTVYLARDERTGSLMAVKEILIAEENDLDISTATKEVDLLRSLRDENIVKYLGSYVDNDAKKLFIFTEWVPGGNLEQNRKKFGGNETIVRRFTHQILRGVAYLHAKNIVHHDIKPSNILVDQHGIVKLADFGASRLISSSTCVNNESMRGTPNYMAPEVIKQTKRSRKSDIWSVGCSVLRLLTGQPFWGDKKFDSQISLLYYVAHLEALPPLPGELSDDARSFISACLAIDPALRPSAMELLQHPFARKVDPSAAKSVRSGHNSSGPARIRTAPVDNLNMKPSADSPLRVVPKRVLNSAPSQLNLLRIRKGAAAAAIATLESFAEPDFLPNASDHPVRLVECTNGVSRRVLGIFCTDREMCVLAFRGFFEQDEHDEGETSIPNFSTTVFPSTHSKAIAPIGVSQKRQHPYLAAKETSFTNVTGATDYTFSEFDQALHHAHELRAKQSPSRWEEEPILTDAARVEREQRSALLAAEKLKKEDRERRYQEELAEFRRHMGH